MPADKPTAEPSREAMELAKKAVRAFWSDGPDCVAAIAIDLDLDGLLRDRRRLRVFLEKDWSLQYTSERAIKGWSEGGDARYWSIVKKEYPSWRAWRTSKLEAIDAAMEAEDE